MKPIQSKEIICLRCGVSKKEHKIKKYPCSKCWGKNYKRHLWKKN